MPTRRERKKQITSRKITDVAVRLIREQGFEKTTMRQIADEADVAIGTLYAHFPSKESIVSVYCHLSMLDQIDDLMRLFKSLPDTKSRLGLYFAQMIKWVTEDRELAIIFFIDGMKRFADDKGSTVTSLGEHDPLAQVLTWGQEQGDIRSDISVSSLNMQLRVAMSAVAMSWLGNPDNGDLADEVMQALDLFLTGAS